MIYITILELIIAIGILYTTIKNKNNKILWVLMFTCLIINLIIGIVI